MNKTPPPPWLQEFQRSFSDMLRTPLDSRSKVFRADSARYQESLCASVVARRGNAPSEHLSVYNRQYWFRLFGALQNEFPLTARLLGFWTFNHHAQRFLLQNPPRDFDLARAADGFLPFLESHEALRPAVLQAGRIDSVWRDVFSAPRQPVWLPNADEAQHLSDLQLIPQQAWALVEEDWPLMRLRESLLNDSGEGMVPLPSRLREAQWWCLVRAVDGIVQMPLAAQQARLYALLTRHPIGVALAKIERESSDGERQMFLGQIQAWLAQSVRGGFWTQASLPSEHL